MPQIHQVAIVTGGSRGIGRAISAHLAAQGTAICVNYSAQLEPAEALVTELHAGGTSAIAVQADVSDPAQANSLIDRAEVELGPPTILVNNAGIAHIQTGFKRHDQIIEIRATESDCRSFVHSGNSQLTEGRAQRFQRPINIVFSIKITTDTNGDEWHSVSASAFDQHSHITGMGYRAALVHPYSTPLCTELLQDDARDLLSQPFDEVCLRRLHVGRDAFSDVPIAQGI